MDPMQVLYQRRCAKYIYVVPSGLRELMSDISREVLRHHPEHIYSFIADYLDSLLITRENAKIAAKMVSNVTENSIIITQLLFECKITRDQADKSARIIQRAFRRHLKKTLPREVPVDEEEILEKIIRRTKISFEQASHAACVIQRAYKRFKLKDAQLEVLGKIDWRLAARRTIGIYRDLKVSREELERAATLIKAAYKGYYTRKLLKFYLEKTCKDEAASCKFEEIEEEEELDVEQEEVIPEEEDNLAELQDYDEIMRDVQNHAAIVIQRAFRKYLQRIQRYDSGRLFDDDHDIMEMLSTVPSDNYTKF